MKIITIGLLITIGCCVSFLTVDGSPIAKKVDNSAAVEENSVPNGRQTAPAAGTGAGVAGVGGAIAPAASEEDDDEDDDDDIEDVIDDGEDDDDDDESTASDDDDDEEDEDYLERFFDDILGEDDDDDDDDVSPSTGIVQQPAAIASVPAAPAVQAVAPAAPAASIQENAEEIAGADYPINEVDAVVYDDDIQSVDGVDNGDVQVLDTAPGDAVKEPSIVGSSVQQSIAGNGQTVATAAAGASSNNESGSSSDEDDEEDDDDIEDALAEDDDDDDDDDEDEDDFIGDDVIVAKRARGAEGEIVSSLNDDESCSFVDNDVTSVPDILINKYNRFVDSIFGRINKILKRSYDPVNVRLSTDYTKLRKSNASKKRATLKKSNNQKFKSTANTKSNNEPVQPIVLNAPDHAPSTHLRTKRTASVNNTADTNIAPGIPSKMITASSKIMIPNEMENRPASGAVHGKKKRKNTRTSTGTVKSNPKPSNKKQSTKKSAQRIGARGILYGLSTLKRQSNVRVNAQADHTTVKCNFQLGPLVLKVEKPYGRGANRSLKSATATTTEMIGRISLRIVNGAATLHSIKVQQPKQVQVDSADNHDRTRKFVWKKSSHIAQVVSQKLTAAARSLLQPPPKN